MPLVCLLTALFCCSGRVEEPDWNTAGNQEMFGIQVKPLLRAVCFLWSPESPQSEARWKERSHRGDSSLLNPWDLQEDEEVLAGHLLLPASNESNETDNQRPAPPRAKTPLVSAAGRAEGPQQGHADL